LAVWNSSPEQSKETAQCTASPDGFRPLILALVALFVALAGTAAAAMIIDDLADPDTVRVRAFTRRRSRSTSRQLLSQTVRLSRPRPRPGEPPSGLEPLTPSSRVTPIAGDSDRQADRATVVLTAAAHEPMP
jgi:hypothetical protein